MENIPKANPPEYYLKIATDYEEKAKKAKKNKDSIYYRNLKNQYMDLYNKRLKQENLKQGILKTQNNNNKVSDQPSIVNDTFSPLHKNTLDNQKIDVNQPTIDTLNPLHENTLDNQNSIQPTNDTLKPLNNQTIDVKQPTIQPTIQTTNDTLNPLHENTLDNRKIEVKQTTNDTLNPLHENTLDNQNSIQPTNDTLKPLNNQTIEVKQPTNDILKPLNNQKIEVKQTTIDTLNPLHENTLNNKTPENNQSPIQTTNDTSINPLNLYKIKKKTRKNNKKLVNTNAEIEMQTLSKPQLNVPVPVPINTKLGFRETLKMRVSKQKPVSVLNPNICQNIFMNGSKVTKKYFYPSEFPKLTKIKPITLSIKKGGKRKQKNSNKRYTRRNYINKQ